MSSEDYNTNSMDAALSRIETKLDTALKTQEEHTQRFEKQEERISKVEGKIKWLAGVATTAGVFISSIWDAAKEWLFSKGN